ncbi:hypothetical protein CONCODRAFT_67893 [Conidiobolus coronatus NRRL 28638]|uniref:PH domain-containing protein n=1 Tax=Conidiobolus coronatus (strain ATCC 28846 / CBS 209.66 / NRRL 28638) TaxID=796925 RepID=A0A137PG46_CONC2|nr:hypothetical protein CONCODRAFT_67893 [Conidiobolus coronatus NRRL 28638]|eukprot:KXN73976.1 hypothetical protein CONCODRAFT_67893 [Conidiobolus coronatus NRRL 28638]
MAISTELQVLTETDFSEFDDLIKQFENFGKGEEFKIKEVKPKELTPEELEEIERKRIIGEKLKTYPIKKIQHKIYIEYKCEHREVQLTSLTTPLLLIESFIHKRFIPPDKTWTLFEVNSGFKCERYVRDWEPITSILENWEPENDNMLVLKRYHARLTDMINLIPSDPPVLSSSAYLEIKPGKWEKRYLFLKRQNIYISKNKSPSGATILCNLSTFDAYTLTTKRKNPPYSFCIALKSQDSILIFEKPERDYVNYLSFENKIILKNWLYAIYYSRNISIWEDRPDDECLFVPPKYYVDSDDITTLEFDQGQFSELDPTVPFKARIKAQKEATSKLRFVKQLFGAGEKKLEINTKPDSEVFKKGSLLDATHSPSSGDSSDSKSTESDSIFASGSLLSRSSSTKVKPVKINEVTNGPLVDASTPTPFLNGSLLDNATQLQESKQTPQRRNGPLIDASAPKHFLEGSLLDSNNSIKRDKHRTLPHNHMINIQANINAQINPMTNSPLQSSNLQKNVSQRQKYRSMLPTNVVPHVNLNTPDAATAPQAPIAKSPPLSLTNNIKTAKYKSMLPAHRASH